MEKPTVLVVDDDLDLLVYVSSVLTAAGYPTYSAVDVGQALELARLHRPRVVLLDHHLPMQPGLSSVARLRADPALARAAIVLLTSRHFEPTDVAHLEGYLRKPSSPEALVAAIEASAA